MTTPTTPEQARELAKNLRTKPTPLSVVVPVLQSLADQVEALTAELSKQEKPVRPMSDDLAALVSRLARALGKANPSHDLPVKAMRYLADNDLLNGPWLRSKEYGATDEDIATFVAHIKGATE